VLFPFVILEDLGLFAPSGFPLLAGHVFLLVTSLSAMLHANKEPDEAEIRPRQSTVAVFCPALRNQRVFHNVCQRAGIKNRLQLFNLLRSDAL